MSPADLRKRLTEVVDDMPLPWYDELDPDWTETIDYLVAALSESKCGCNCICHTDEAKPDWPGPCAGCCEPGMDCECGRYLVAHFAVFHDRSDKVAKRRPPKRKVQGRKLKRLLKDRATKAQSQHTPKGY